MYCVFENRKKFPFKNYGEIPKTCNPADGDPWDIFAPGYHIKIPRDKKYKIKKKPDYIIISGALNLPMDDYFSKFKKTIYKMYKYSNNKCIFNLLSSSSKRIYEYNAYTNIGKISKYLESLSNLYLIDKSYLSHDLTIVLIKNNE